MLQWHWTAFCHQDHCVPTLQHLTELLCIFQKQTMGQLHQKKASWSLSESASASMNWHELSNIPFWWYLTPCITLQCTSAQVLILSSVMSAQEFAVVLNVVTANPLLLFCIRSAESITLRKIDTSELQKIQRMGENRIIHCGNSRTECVFHTGIRLPTLSQNSFLWCTF